VLINGDGVGTAVGCFVVGLSVDGGSAGALLGFNDGDPLVGLLDGNCELAGASVGLPVVGDCDGALLSVNAVRGHIDNLVDGN